MAPHPVLLLANLFSGQTQLGSIVPKPPSKSQGEFVDRNFSFKWGVSPLQRRPEKSRERKECTVPVAAHGASSFEQRVERAVAAICLTKLRQLSQLRPRLCSILVSAAHKHQRRFDYTCKLVAPLRETLQRLDDASAKVSELAWAEWFNCTSNLVQQTSISMLST